MGRHAKEFSKQDLQEIEVLAGMGLTQIQIAHIKGICEDTLRKHAYDIWKRGKSKGLGKVTQAAYKMATSGKHPVMTKFFLQTQGGPEWQVTPAIPKELLKLFAKLDKEAKDV